MSEVRIVRARADAVATCLAIRRAVFVEEQGIDERLERDGVDEVPTVVHLLAWRGEAPVGTARLTPAASALKVQRIAVVPAHRGLGIGAAIVRHAIELAAGRAEVARVTLGAQASAIGFYERLGFVPVGPRFMDAGIAHQEMVFPIIR